MLRGDEPPAALPARWIEGSGCDGWVLWSKTQDPLTYAALWNRSRDAAAYREALDRWTAYFAALGAGAIGMGAVVLRRRAAAANWIRTDQVPEGQLDAADRHIQRIFATETRLSGADDRALLSMRFAAAPDHRLHQSIAFRDGEYVTDAAEVRFDEGLRFAGSVDAATIRLLAACDGRRTLAEIATAVAETGGPPAGDVTGARTVGAQESAARGLVGNPPPRMRTVTLYARKRPVAGIRGGHAAHEPRSLASGELLDAPGGSAVGSFYTNCFCMGTPLGPPARARILEPRVPGAGTSGRHAVRHLRKYIDSASPRLFESCCQGEHLQEAMLTVRKAGETQQEYLKITLNDVLISAVAPGGAAGGDQPLEQISFSFGSATLQTAKLDPKGGAQWTSATTCGGSTVDLEELEGNKK